MVTLGVLIYAMGISYLPLFQTTITSISNFLIFSLSAVALVVSILAISFTLTEYSRFKFKQLRDRMILYLEKTLEPLMDFYSGTDGLLDTSSFFGDAQLKEDSDKKINLFIKKEWIPEKPKILGEADVDPKINLELKTKQINRGSLGGKHLIPMSYLFRRYDSFSSAIQFLEGHVFIEHRPLFVLDRFQEGKIYCRVSTYRKFIDTSEILALESIKYLNIKDMKLNEGRMKLRKRLSSPPNFKLYEGGLGINTLTVYENTIAVDSSDRWKFILHYRDPSKVSAAKGFLHVVPAGEFEAQGNSPEIIERDFRFWRTILREYNEELLGGSEIYYGDDYLKTWPFSKMEELSRKGEIKCFFLGMTVDLPNLKPNVLTVCVFRGDSFKQIFGNMVSKDAEGDVIDGLSFNEQNIKFLLHDKREAITESAKFILLDSWKYREIILN